MTSRELLHMPARRWSARTSSAPTSSRSPRPTTTPRSPASPPRTSPTSCCPCWPQPGAHDRAPQRRRRRRRDPGRARRRHHLRHPRHAQPGALPALRRRPASGAITPRHEQGAGYAAEAYARVSGRPGVVVTTSGPGLTNAMTAAATAYAESQPMLVLSPGMPTGTEGRDLGQLHEAKNTSAAMDAAGALEPPGAQRRRGGRGGHRGVRVVPGRRPRPVHIEIPIDVLEQAWSGEPRVAARRSRAARRPGRRAPGGRAARRAPPAR